MWEWTTGFDPTQKQSVVSDVLITFTFSILAVFPPDVILFQSSLVFVIV